MAAAFEAHNASVPQGGTEDLLPFPEGIIFMTS